MKATLPRGEAYEFLELGAHLERADSTARLLSVTVPGLAAAAPATVSNARLSSLLKSCGAFEAFRKQESDDELRPERVVAFLLLERRLPRAVLLLPRAVPSSRSERSRARRCGPSGRSAASSPSSLSPSFTRSTRRRSSFSAGCMLGIADAADEIAAGYFTTRTVPPGPYAQQQATAAMILRVEHTTEFAYDGPIAEAYTELRLRPLEGGGQHCSSFRLDTEPPGVRVREYRDHFGNTSTTSTCSSRTTGST